ncbi:hypothetical protein GCM10008096_18320 [Zhihengliuella salsuginis]|uniref:Uncharacterized protein n=1 Tax=Zhihengliuella salsuginis TaxID=578222 RepID=A0ABQ3GJM1_9MICC|nr:hypothetical protein GCM10008096_18320 [Zhihengliuella salsuginis]
MSSADESWAALAPTADRPASTIANDDAKPVTAPINPAVIGCEISERVRTRHYPSGGGLVARKSAE